MTISNDVIERRKQQLEELQRTAGVTVPVDGETGPATPGENGARAENGGVGDATVRQRMAQLQEMQRAAGVTAPTGNADAGTDDGMNGAGNSFAGAPGPSAAGTGAATAAAGSRKPVVTQEVLAKAMETLKKYQSGKQNLEKRIIGNEEWYRQQYWKNRETDSDTIFIPSSGWAFNSIANKHADLMDNIPECTCLPQEKSDEQTAQILTSVLPVVFEQAHFEKIYDDYCWDIVKNGIGVIGVFWNPKLENGLGGIDVKCIDVMNLFWEPGVTEIQKSQNIFTVELCNNDVLTAMYPQCAGKLGTPTVSVDRYIYDDTIDTANKSAVIDWYYKKIINGKTVLCYAKFVDGVLLYSSEDDPNMFGPGGLKSFYENGDYPFVVGAMFPVKGTLAGFGYIDIMRDNAITIDRLNAVIVRNAEQGAMRRYFVRSGAALNEEEFADWTKPFIHITDGNLGEDNMREYTPVELSGSYISVLQAKVDELKETSGNRDFAQGSTTAGVTSGAAISALQEAGSKLSRDNIKGVYRTYKKTVEMVIERIRQFYTLPRVFRIIGDGGQTQYMSFDNTALQPQQQMINGQDFGSRLPIFDIKVKAHKSNPFSRTANNQDAINYFSMGFFNPQLCDQALAALEIMEFEGKERIIEIVKKNGGMAEKIQKLQQLAMALAQQLDSEHGGETAFAEGLVADGYLGNEYAGAAAAKGGGAKLAGSGTEAPTNKAAKERTAAHTEV